MAGDIKIEKVSGRESHVEEVEGGRLAGQGL